MAATTKYICNHPVQHDGDLYAIDAEIELEKKHAQALLEVGAIRKAAKEKPAKDPGDKTE